MNYLLDTHVLLWSMFREQMLSDTVKSIIETADHLYVSIASLWEIAIKQSLGKSRKGYPLPKVKTSRKKFEKSLKSFKIWLYANKEQPARMIVSQLNVKLVGYYLYYGVSP